MGVRVLILGIYGGRGSFGGGGLGEQLMVGRTRWAPNINTTIGAGELTNSWRPHSSARWLVLVDMLCASCN